MTTLTGFAECNEKRFAEAKFTRGPEFRRVATEASSMRHLLGRLAAKTGVVRQDPAATDNPANLHVIAVLFNFHRFKAPVANFERFKSHMAQLGVTLHVVELVLGQAPFEVTDARNPLHIQLRTDTEFFQKENLVNIGVANLTKRFPDWRYMAWIDGDITFFNPTAITDTLYRLQRHPVVQMWSKACDLGPDGMPMDLKGPNGSQSAIVSSFAYCYANRADRSVAHATYWHPGYAWAMRRETFEAVGGLYENAILGAADHHMACAFIGEPARGIHGQASEGYKRDALAWCERASTVVKSDLGYVPGLIHHHWHGRKADRKYVERWSILVAEGYDPPFDLRKESNGLLKLTGRSRGLQDGTRTYLIQRNDDANTLA